MKGDIDELGHGHLVESIHTRMVENVTKQDRSSPNEAWHPIQPWTVEEGGPSTSVNMDEVQKNRGDGMSRTSGWMTSQRSQTFPSMLAFHGRVTGPVGGETREKTSQKVR